MRLLIITQKVDINDDILGFFHGWIEEFAKHCEKLTVICLEKGEYDLPGNVKILSLRKEKSLLSPRGFLQKIKYTFLFYKHIWRERGNYNTVFVHMNPEYIILGWKLWWILGKKTSLWYTHKNVDFKLWLAEKFVGKIFTASEKSFRLKSKKVQVMGHGIDTNSFQLSAFSFQKKQKNEKFKILTVGRIAKSKNLDLLIDVAEILKNKDFSTGDRSVLGWEIKIAGAPILDKDKIYFEELKKRIKEKNLEDKIKFVGKISHKDIAGFYQKGNLFVNFSGTGSIDKAVLEAMASGLQILTSNEAFKNILPERNFTGKNPQKIADKIIILSKTEPSSSLRDYVVKNHNMESLIRRIAENLK